MCCQVRSLNDIQMVDGWWSESKMALLVCPVPSQGWLGGWALRGLGPWHLHVASPAWRPQGNQTSYSNGLPQSERPRQSRAELHGIPGPVRKSLRVTSAILYRSNLSPAHSDPSGGGTECPLTKRSVNTSAIFLSVPQAEVPLRGGKASSERTAIL